MPLEQVGGFASVDHGPDLYSAGVVAYRALSGRLPYLPRVKALRGGSGDSEEGHDAGGPGSTR